MTGVYALETICFPKREKRPKIGRKGNGLKKFTDRFLDPTNDIPFKKLFGSNENKGILLELLNNIFAGVYPKIEEVTPLSPNHIPEVMTWRRALWTYPAAMRRGIGTSSKCNAIEIVIFCREPVFIAVGLISIKRLKKRAIIILSR
jgi:hypothetical protein